MTDPVDVRLAEVVRNEAGPVVASLHRLTGNFDVAEEAVQDAVVSALAAWRRDGIPANPGAWLSLAARRKAIDRLRRSSREHRALEALAEVGPAPAAEAAEAEDERVPMLFGCCHPALAVEARLALSLRAVVGLTTEQIAAAFLVPEPTLAQRIVRAKRKIVANGIRMAVPRTDLRRRLDDVLTVVYLTYNAGFLQPPATESPPWTLAEDAVWLAELVTNRLPGEPEAWGLMALLTLQQSRAPARFTDAGELVLLSDQDRSRWDHVSIARAERMLERGAAFRRPGRFQLQAAIAACHASAPTWAETDWLQILTLYDILLRYDGSPVVRLNRAIAVAEYGDPEAALVEVAGLEGRLAGYHLFHATRAALLRRLGQADAARRADERALALAANPVEQNLLRARLR